jgi:hypothetical protein
MKKSTIRVFAVATLTSGTAAFSRSVNTSNIRVSIKQSSIHPPTRVFAGGGFGGGGSTSKSKGKKKGKTKGGNPKMKSQPNLFTPEGRMEHIQNRIQSADISSLAKLSLQKMPDGELSLDIDPNAMAVVDNFLGEALITAMRNEAESLLPSMVPSQSTRWDEESQSVIAYEKVGVLSTQIEGGAVGYEKSPRLVEYIVTLTAHLSHKLNQLLPDDCVLSGQEQTNKLAVCLGEGSYYDKHIDNLGGTSNAGDRRKLTALLYMQPPGSHAGQPPYPMENFEDDARGGYFRAYDVPEMGDVTCIAPRGDRLVLFWSDSLVHDVSPSFAPNGDADRRWALTVWFIADEGGKIRATDAEVEKRHFGANSGIGRG